MRELLGERGTGSGERSDYAAGQYRSPFPLPRSPRVLTWHLLVDAHGRSGAENMALDQALLDEVAACDDGTAYLRLYHWNPPCLSFGRHEPALARYDRAAIERLGLHVVRRPTGGRAVWHQHEVTYAVTAPVAAFGSLQASYLAMHVRLAGALRTLGADAEVAAPQRRAPGPSAGPCFAQPVGGEILIHGRKVVGSAQVRQGAAFLQHGSILLGGTQDVVSQVSRRATTPAHATTLSAELGRAVTFQDVTTAICDRWLEAQEGWASSPAALPFCRPGSFSDPTWTWRR